MNDFTDQEQLDRLKAWWRENRGMVLGGIALGIAVILGFRYYTASQVEAAMAASTEYEALVEAVADDSLDPAIEIAETLYADYGSTVYARQARLAMARLYMNRGRDADAAEVLRPLATAGDGYPLALVARYRLGRVLLYQEKPQDVIDLIGTPGETAFTARYQDLLGDAHYALGNVEQASSAWTAALTDPRARQTVDVQFLQMKLDDLPATAAADTAAAPAPVGDAMPMADGEPATAADDATDGEEE